MNLRNEQKSGLIVVLWVALMVGGIVLAPFSKIALGFVFGAIISAVFIAYGAKYAITAKMNSMFTDIDEVQKNVEDVVGDDIQ